MLLPGQSAPLGSQIREENGVQGVNFAVYAADAQQVVLCLFIDGREKRLALHKEGDIWHGFMPGIGAGTRYGYRVQGKTDPARGRLFNPAKLLIDPYSKAIDGKPDFSTPEAAARFHWQDAQDNAALAPKSVVMAESAFDWGDDARPNTPWGQTIIYEAHVKGFSKRHPRIPAAIAGTFAGMAHPESIRHLKRLGVTAVELLPIAYSIDEAHVQQKGLKNYWGYNVLGHFAVNPELAAYPDYALDEFKMLVRTLHRVGIEVILDVVFNHTAEGERKDPMLCQRGIANDSYYWLNAQGSEENYSGCGNAINASHPVTLAWILDCLRYWAHECHVDGFRFDLASILGRTTDFTASAPFFAAIAADPLLRELKMIAEPWDIGWGGYQLGQFPAPFSEWNDRFRDDLRRFFCQESGEKNILAQRLAGSDDVFAHPAHSINFLTAHDGFTLQDLVSYTHKHNHANGEDNRDGHHENFSDNHGVEGVSDDAEILAARDATRRALLAALLLANGTPMLLAGDELGNSQHGNNNTYCQDNDIAWLDWANADHALTDYCAALIRLRRSIPLLRENRRWTAEDVRWLNAQGEPLQVDDWHNPADKALQIVMDNTLILINGERRARTFQLPPGQWHDALGAQTSSPSLRTLTQMEVCVLSHPIP